MKLRAACVVVGFLSLVMSLAQLTFAQMPTQTASALPRLVRFGSTVKDPNGNPLTGVVGITFALYTEQTGGAALWLETQNVTTDSNGHYTAVLGSTKPDGLPTELFTTEQARWVGVQVSGQAEQSRVLLVSAPYALKAGDAETLGGKPASAYALATPQTATSAPTSESAKPSAAVNASTNNQSSIQAAISGSGTKNYIPLWTSSTALGNSNIFQNATNKDIGIGTATPTATLDVKGNVVFTGNQTVNGLLSVNGGTASVASATFNSAGGFILEGRSNGTNEFNVDGTGNLFANGSLFTTGYIGAGTAFFADAAAGVVAVSTSASSPAGNFTGFNAPSGSNGSGTDGIDSTGGNGDPNAPFGDSYGGNGVTATGGTGGTGAGVGGSFMGGNSGAAGVGIFVVAGNGDLAGDFLGNVNVSGSFSAGAKNFKIDHPLDPANKYLVHASVESSEMMNIYTGNVTTDAQGQATVQLPEWFEELNTDFRYQLTVIGQFAQAIVAREIEHNHFEIRTSAPNVKVSWQVTGVRQDAYAKANPLVVEQEKEARLRGFYIHPELYGAPPEKQIEWARHPQMMKKMKEMRAKQLAASQKQAVPQN